MGPSRDAEKPIIERTFQVEGQPGQRLEMGTKRQGGWEGRHDDGEGTRGVDQAGWHGERDTGSRGGVSSRGWCSPFLRPPESPFSFSLETPWR